MAPNKKKEAGNLPIKLEGTNGDFEVKVLSSSLSGPQRTSAVTLALSTKDMKHCQLERGDAVLLTSPTGRRSVASCDIGGPGGGAVISPALQRSLNVQEGETVIISMDFIAEEAAELRFEVPAKLNQVWAQTAGALKLDRYLNATFDGTLLFAGDLRTISVNGQWWDVRVLECKSTQPRPGGKSSEGEGPDPPRLVTTSTKVVANFAGDSSESIGGRELGSGAAPPASHGFGRVGGLKQVVEELKEVIQLPLQKPELYRRLGVTPPRGVLLYGPPGTGKTLLAKSLAEELDCPVELCAATDLVGRGIGESEKRILDIFNKCRQAAETQGTGALLFIDEIDAICPKRDDATEAERRMVATLLTELDGSKSDDCVIVIGATNRPDSIDPAIRRAGRMEREIEVGVPNVEDRTSILEVHLQAIKHTLSETDRKELARRCHGYVGADLRSLCLAAARATLKKGLPAVTLETCMESMRLVSPSALKELHVEIPTIRWSDIGGYESTKDALREAVEWPVVHAWAFEALDIDPPRGILLYGPPGCSKTMMAKAVATETEMNFISVKGPELFSKYVGDSEKAIRDVFRKARTAAPCVIFFDEIDAIGASREGEGGGGVSARVLAQLLAEMDGVGASGRGISKRHVVVLAATNRPHVLDTALMRPGRFDRLVHVPLPDDAARSAVFFGALRKMKVNDDPAMLIPDLVRRTAGCSGAEVVMACREAAMLAIRQSIAEGASTGIREPSVKREHLLKALESVQPRISAETVQFYVDFERKMRGL